VRAPLVLLATNSPDTPDSVLRRKIKKKKKSKQDATEYIAGALISEPTVGPGSGQILTSGLCLSSRGRCPRTITPPGS
jgi:hypothetical protein